MIYARNKNGTKITWGEKEDLDISLAERAAKDVVGEVGVTVTTDGAREILDRYRTLHVEKYGQDSPFYETQ